MKLKFVVTKIVTSSVEVEIEVDSQVTVDTDAIKTQAKRLAMNQFNFSEDEVEYIVESNN